MSGGAGRAMRAALIAALLWSVACVALRGQPDWIDGSAAAYPKDRYLIGVGEGDEVILPGYTCVMDVNPIKYLSAKPVYVDIEPDMFNMSVKLL